MIDHYLFVIGAGMFIVSLTALAISALLEVQP